MQTIPVKMYTRTQRSYPDLPEVACFVFPETREYQRNAEASSGAKLTYIVNEWALMECKKKINNVSGVPDGIMYRFDGYPDKCCLHCKHYEALYSQNKHENGMFRLTEQGRCLYSGRIDGKNAKAKGCCANWERK